ncbi:phage tail protein [Thalassotalea atypica]|uniref:phage tail protein n=1 Tax=Thalassotalea atypica TaxID=2054316 RepID=UPI002572A83A|nr:tail fiber protein [Thalassotalea atypica]
MSEPFLAEVKIVGFNFSPRGWALCDGQILPINQNQSLYSLLGTAYGGDGRTSFALPDMRGRTPMHVGDGISQGERSGDENHILQESEIPAHTHQARASSATASSSSGTGNLLGVGAGGRRPLTPYGSLTQTAALTGNQVSTTGGQGHNNMQPYLALNFVIALQGLFPSRN